MAVKHGQSSKQPQSIKIISWAQIHLFHAFFGRVPSVVLRDGRPWPSIPVISMAACDTYRIPCSTRPFIAMDLICPPFAVQQPAEAQIIDRQARYSACSHV